MKPTMQPTQDLPQAELTDRWERLGLGVRCAYNPTRPEVLQRYLQAGRLLSRLQPAREARIQGRMLDVLLQTANDSALPWLWRAACLEHTAWPLARLTSLQRQSAPPPGPIPSPLEARVGRAIDLLGPPSETLS